MTWQRAGHRPGGISFTPKKMVAAQKVVRSMAQAIGWTPFDCDVRMELDFYMPTRRRVDLDNLIKLVLDALNGRPARAAREAGVKVVNGKTVVVKARPARAAVPGIVYLDDSQVSDLRGRRYYDKLSPRTVIRVQAAQGPETTQDALSGVDSPAAAVARSDTSCATDDPLATPS